MAGIRERDKRAAEFRDSACGKSCTTFVLCSQYVLFRGGWLLPVFDPECPGLILACPDSYRRLQILAAATLQMIWNLGLQIVGLSGEPK